MTGMQRCSDCRKQEARVQGRADEEDLDRVGGSGVSGLQVPWPLILRRGSGQASLALAFGSPEDATPDLTCIVMDRRASKGG